MKILHVVQAYYPFQERGGPVVKVRALAGNAALHGHRVTVLTADLGLANRPQIVNRPEKSAWGSRLVLDGVEAIYLPTIARYRALTVNAHAIDFCRDRLDECENGIANAINSKTSRTGIAWLKWWFWRNQNDL